MRVKVTDYIADFLYENGVTEVYEVVGGMITHLVDSIHLKKKIRLVSVHHEQAASFAADASGRVKGVPGVAMATSGPGAINLLTGIGSAYFDSSPSIFITGQVNRDEQKKSRAVRQLGFQEADIVAMAAPVTKGAWLVEAPEQIPDLLAKAFSLSVSGRPGPVLLDIPMDVQRSEISVEAPVKIKLLKSNEAPDAETVIAALLKSKKPLILAGGGVQSSKSTALLKRFAEISQTPVVFSLMAVDVLPSDHPLRAGFIGSYGNRWANLAIGASDLMIVLGSRLDIRQTGSKIDAFKGKREIYHIDCDKAEVNNRITGCHSILSDLPNFLERALAALEKHPKVNRAAWLSEIQDLKKAWPDNAEQKTEGIHPNAFMHELSRASQSASAIVSDVGQHQMWAAQSLELKEGQRFLTSGGMGAMGFALPAAIGAYFAAPGKPVVMVAGDGGFQLNLQELQTVFRNKLPIKMVVLNNHCHGMVRQFQQSYFGERYASTLWGYTAPDFAKVAAAYGIESAQISDPSEISKALSQLWKNPDAPFFLEVDIHEMANAYPKIAFGQPMTEMEPMR